MDGYGYRFETLHVTGGHVHNPLLLELYADVTRCQVVVPETQDAVLLGTAMTAAVAGGIHAGLAAAGQAMAARALARHADLGTSRSYDRDYRRFLAMVRHRAELLSIS